jgi:hypothetical protein
MSHSLTEALRELTSNERKITRLVSQYGDAMTRRQIGKIIREHFPKKRARQEEEEEEEYEEEEDCARTLSTLSEDCQCLKALTYMYSQTDRNDPYSRFLFDKMRKVAERIEPSEALEGDNVTVDTIVNMTDRIRHFFPEHQGDVPKETLFEIGKLAKEYHIEYYQCPPTKTQRTIDGQEKFINVYTEETAPNTLDRAIREVMMNRK